MTGRGTVKGWSLLLAPGWWHVAINERRYNSVQAMLNRLLASLPRDQVAAWRRELAREINVLVDSAAEQGATDLYLLADQRYGLPVPASCLATVVPTAPPEGTPAEALAHALAERVDDECGVIVINGVRCARIRRRDSGTGVVPIVEGETSAERLAAVAAALPVTRLLVYVPFPDRERMLLLSFSTPIDDIADAMVGLFEAMAGSLRWTWEAL